MKNIKIDFENLPYAKIKNFTSPNKRKTVYTAEDYKKIAEKSLKDYLASPKAPYSSYFMFNLAQSSGSMERDDYLSYENIRYYICG